MSFLGDDPKDSFYVSIKQSEVLVVERVIEKNKLFGSSVVFF
jgi:hypothetical protein